MTYYRALSVFDLDYTLLSVNCSFRLGLYLYRHRLLARLPLLLAALIYSAHRLRLCSLQRLHRLIFKICFRGMALVELELAVSQFLEEAFEEMLFQPAVERLQQSQRQGHYTLLLSNSPHFLVAPIAHRLGFDEWSATYYGHDYNGRLDAISSVLEGEQKADYVQGCAARLCFPLTLVTAYSDSYLDLPLLEIAGKPVAVKPDRRLLRICRLRGWEMIY